MHKVSQQQIIFLVSLQKNFKLQKQTHFFSFNRVFPPIIKTEKGLKIISEKDKKR